MKSGKLKKIISLLMFRLLFSEIIVTGALHAISLSDWTVQCFKNLPENFKLVNYINPHNTLSYGEFESTIKQFITTFQHDVNFNNNAMWVDKEKPPAWLFNPEAPENKKEIAYPYVQKIILNTGDEICLIGDLHGSAYSLLRSLWRLLLKGYIDDNLKIIKDGFYLVALGDYTDRGVAPLETMYTLAQLKLANWNNVFLLRGNHDSWEHGVHWSFTNNVLSKVPEKSRDSANKNLHCFYNLLPHAIFIGTEKDFILCVHGGADASFDPSKLLRNKNISFAQLKESHHKENVGSHNNLFLWRWYNTPAINEDVKYLNDFNNKSDIKKSDIKIHAIFRGHQHSETTYGLGMLNEAQAKLMGDKDDFWRLFPHWTEIVGSNDIDANGAFSIANPKYIPIFTLLSAPGNYTEYDCFVILSTSQKYEDWKLKPYEIELDTHSSNLMYAKISEDSSKDVKKLIKTAYQDQAKGPFNKPISDELLSKAKATILTGRLKSLKESLSLLKSKLELLKTKLGTVRTKLKKTA